MVIIVRLSSNCHLLTFVCYHSLVLAVFLSVLHSQRASPCPLLFIPHPVSPLAHTPFTRRFSAAGHFLLKRLLTARLPLRAGHGEIFTAAYQ